MKFILILFLFAPLSVFCQKSDSLRARRIAVGIIYSPDYCYRTLKPDASSKWIADYRDANEIPKFGFTTGIGIKFRLNRRFALETGLQFSDKGEQTKKLDLISAQPDPDLPEKVSLIYHYRYLDIPLKANYIFAFSKRNMTLHFMKKATHGKTASSGICFFVSGGISTNIFLDQKTNSILEYSDGHTMEMKSTADELSRVNLAAVAGLGMSFMASPRTTIRIEPVYRHSITPILDAPIKQYLYSAGVNVGIYFSL